MSGFFALPLYSEDDTQRLGALLAERLKPGALVLLDGDLGAGKTALARAIIRALAGDPELEVPSPSFALVQPYDAKGVAVLHADFYRLSEASETRELGLFDDPHAIVLVEWPDRDPELADTADLALAIRLSGDEGAREVALMSPSGRFDCEELYAAF